MSTSSRCTVLRGGGLVARRQFLATESLLARETASSYSALMRLCKMMDGMRKGRGREKGTVKDGRRRME